MKDTIYRQQAIHAFDDAGFCTHDYIVDVLKELPLARSEQKSGRWIAHEGGKFVGFPYMHYECSQCRAFEPTETNFCPNCGADMRGESDG